MARFQGRTVSRAGKAFKVEGIKELEQKVRDLGNAIAGMDAQKLLGRVAEEGKTRMLASAASQGVPRQVQLSVFAYAGRKPKSRILSALFGLRKRGRNKPWAPGYREWSAGRQRGGGEKTQRSAKKGRPARLTMPGTLIGESLGTMWELGTTKMAARPWGGRAYDYIRQRAPQILAEGYRAILAKFAKP